MDYSTIFFIIGVVASIAVLLPCHFLQEKTATLFNADGTDNVTVSRKWLFCIVALGLFWIIAEICLGILFPDVGGDSIFIGIAAITGIISVFLANVFYTHKHKIKWLTAKRLNQIDK